MDGSRKNPEGTSLSEEAKVHIQQIRCFRGHPSSHKSAIAALVVLIRAGDVAHPDDALAFCTEEEWTHAEMATLIRTIDNVGRTLKHSGIIAEWTTSG